MKCVNILAITLFSMISFATSRRDNAKEREPCGDADGNGLQESEICGAGLICCDLEGDAGGDDKKEIGICYEGTACPNFSGQKWAKASNAGAGRRRRRKY